MVFSVDERLTGRPQVPNDEVAAFAAENSDIVMAFASVDPMRGRGSRERSAPPDRHRRHSRIQAASAAAAVPRQRQIAYPFYEVLAEAKLPVIFHTGHSGIGTGMPGGGGVRLKYGNPMDIDDVAVDFPDMPIIMAHPSFPWQDEAISVCLHKPQVYIDLSGWSPKYFSPILIQYANTLLKNKMLFGSDYPSDHARSMDDRLRRDRHSRRSAAADFERKRRPLVLAELEPRLRKGTFGAPVHFFPDGVP